MKEERKMKNVKGLLNPSLSRRTFLKASGALGAAAAGGAVFLTRNTVDAQAAIRTGQFDPDALDSDADVFIMNTVCLQCHSACGIRCKVKNGVITKIDGNPYHPNNLEDDERLAYGTTPANAKSTVGRCCAKAQAYMETVYSPYRIKQPLKRVGARGSGQWKAISWDDVMDEIANGGTFDDGYTHNGIKGHYDNWTDPIVGAKYPEALLGGKGNQVAFAPGRLEHGQKEFTDRFWKYGFGTVNYRWDHTSICEQSHHDAHKMATSTGKTKFFPDYINCKYVVFFGTSPLEAGFPMISKARKIMRMKSGGGKIAVVDPRLSKTAAKADTWVPIIPGTDAALALAMARYMIDNNRYDAVVLSHTKAGVTRAADATGLYSDYDGKEEKSYSNATYLVVTNNGGSANIEDGAFLRDSHVNGGAGTDYQVATALSPDTIANHSAVNTALIEVEDISVLLDDGKTATCSSAFTLFKNSLDTIANYSTICGVSTTVIAQLATDLTSYGKQAACHYYRGPVQHTNGVYTALSLFALNILIGNFDWKGGIGVGGSHYDEVDGDPLRDLDELQGGKRAFAGVPLNRAQKKGTGGTLEYTDTAEYTANGFPATRPWFPFAAHGNFQEGLASIDAQYPYPLDALFMYWNDWAYSTPAAKGVAETGLTDTTKLPIFVAFDIEFGETSALADYILPDSSILERWSTPHVGPTIVVKTSGVRQPVVGKVLVGGAYVDISSLTPTALVAAFAATDGTGNDAWDTNPYYLPVLPDTRVLEDILLDLGINYLTADAFAGIGSAATGTGGLQDGAGGYRDFYRAWDWYEIMIQNLVASASSEADPPADVADVLSKGGAFGAIGSGWSGDHLKKLFGARADLYVEALAATKDSMTGKFFHPMGQYDTLKDVMDNEINDSGYPYTLITYKDSYHAQARTVCNPTLMSMKPENFVEMNAQDAATAGISSGDSVKVTCVTNATGVIGTALATNRIMPGVVAIAHSFGHWEMGAKPHIVDGQLTDYDSERAAGVAGNPVQRLDPYLGNVGLQDKIGASSSFFDTQVKVTKV